MIAGGADLAPGSCARPAPRTARAACARIAKSRGAAVSRGLLRRRTALLTHRRLRRASSSRASSARPPTSSPRTTCAPARGRSRRAGRAPRRPARSCSPPRRSRARRCCACSPRRGCGCDVASGGELAPGAAAPGFEPERIVLHGNAKSRRRAADGGRAPGRHGRDRQRATTSTGSSALGRRRRAAVLLRVDPGRRRRHPRARSSPARPARSSGCRRRGAARERCARARADLAGPAHAHRLAAASTSSRTARAVAAIAELGDFAVYDLGGGLAVAVHAERRRRRRVDEWVGGDGRAPRTTSCGDGQGAVHRAGPRAGRQRGRDALHGRVGQAAASPASGRGRRRRDVATTCARCSTARAYEADARRPRRRRAATPCTVVGKHCESGDVLVRETALPDPRPGRRARHARSPAPTGTRWPTTTTACRGRRSIFCAGGERARGRAPRDLRGPACPRRIRVGLLGHGTVGAAFEQLLAERADAIEPITGARPEITGVLTRSRGDFEEILDGSRPDRRADRRHRAGARLRAAGDAAPASTSSRPTSCCSPSTARSCGRRAREHGVQLRFEGAVAGVVPVIRVLQESLAAAHVERIHGIVNGTTNYILTEMARGGLVLRRRARPGAGARLRRGRPDRRRHRPRRRGQDGDPRPARVLHAGAPRPGRLRGDRAHHRRGHRLRAASSASG